MNEEKRQVVVCLATDWCYYCEQAPATCGLFDPIDGIIVGIVVEEDDDKLVLAHQWFPEQDEVRHVTSLTKSSIQEIYRINIEDLPEG